MKNEYYIWADGAEAGPFTFEQLYEGWKTGGFPKGFLWRRSDNGAFSDPSELSAEKARRDPPIVPIRPFPLPISDQATNTRKPRKFTPAGGIWAFMVVTFVLSPIAIFIGVAFSSATVGGFVFTMGVMVIGFILAGEAVRALSDIRALLEEANQMSAERDARE